MARPWPGPAWPSTQKLAQRAVYTAHHTNTNSPDTTFTKNILFPIPRTTLPTVWGLRECVGQSIAAPDPWHQPHALHHLPSPGSRHSTHTHTNYSFLPLFPPPPGRPWDHRPARHKTPVKPRGSISPAPHKSAQPKPLESTQTHWNSSPVLEASGPGSLGREK